MKKSGEQNACTSCTICTIGLFPAIKVQTVQIMHCLKVIHQLIIYTTSFPFCFLNYLSGFHWQCKSILMLIKTKGEKQPDILSRVLGSHCKK